MKARVRLEEIITLTGDIKAFIGVNRQPFIVADIGCDHGWVASEVLRRNIAQEVICSDISKKSLEKAEILLSKSGKKNNAKFIVSDGLTNFDFKKRIDVAIIAGMGAYEIIHILSGKKNVDKVKCFIFQVSTDEYLLRQFLLKNGFFIIYDKMIYDHGHIYHTIAVKNEFNCTLQSATDCGKLCMLADENRKLFAICNNNKFASENDFGVNFLWYGADNLFDVSVYHKKALNFVKTRLNDEILKTNIKIEEIGQKKAAEGSILERLEELKARLSSINAIIHRLGD